MEGAHLIIRRVCPVGPFHGAADEFRNIESRLARFVAEAFVLLVRESDLATHACQSISCSGPATPDPESEEAAPRGGLLAFE